MATGYFDFFSISGHLRSFDTSFIRLIPIQVECETRLFFLLLLFFFGFMLIWWLLFQSGCQHQFENSSFCDPFCWQYEKRDEKLTQVSSVIINLSNCYTDRWYRVNPTSWSSSFEYVEMPPLFNGWHMQHRCREVTNSYVLFLKKCIQFNRLIFLVIIRWWWTIENR